MNKFDRTPPPDDAKYRIGNKVKTDFGDGKIKGWNSFGQYYEVKIGRDEIAIKESQITGLAHG